jgi:hypothetical protein
MRAALISFRLSQRERIFLPLLFNTSTLLAVALPH